MNVGLVDVDSKIPNLALMRLSAYHKAHGDSVKWFEPLTDSPDVVYASKMFDFTPDYDHFPTCCDVKRGGPAYDLKAHIPEEAEHMVPDYSMYPGCTFSIGRFTRGCLNRCPWCVVPKMDGNVVREVATLDEFWGGHDTVRVLDDNILAMPDAFIRACDQMSSRGLYAVFDALDIRLVNDDVAKAIAGLRVKKTKLHFSWDGHSQDDAIGPGIECLARNGVKPYRLTFYVLVGFNTDKEYDLHRIRTLWETYHVWPFVMPFDKSDRYQRDLARWCNNRFVFKSTSWENYKGGNHD